MLNRTILANTSNLPASPSSLLAAIGALFLSMLLSACGSSSSEDASEINIDNDELSFSSSNFSGVYETDPGFGFEHAYLVITPEGVISTYKYTGDGINPLRNCYLLVNDHRTFENISGDTYSIEYLDRDLDPETVTIRHNAHSIRFSGEEGSFDYNHPRSNLNIADLSPDCDAISDRPQQSFAGHVVGGSIAGARVYIDINNNARLDDGETWALTDIDGFFSSAKDGLTNYCASDASTKERRHCLSAADTGNDVILRVYRGFDSLTGEPFMESMSVRVDSEKFTSDGFLEHQIISPITSLLTDLSESDKAAFASAYNLDLSKDGNRDFLSTAFFDADTTQAAISLYKVVSIFSSVFDEHYDAIEDLSSNFPNSNSHFIYQAIADLVDNGIRLTPSNLEDVFDASEVYIRAFYLSEEKTTEEFISIDVKAKSVSNTGKVLTLIDTILSSSGTDATRIDNVAARMINIEIIVQKILEDQSESEIDATLIEASAVDSLLSRAIQAALDTGKNLYGSDFVDIDFDAPHDLSILGITSIESLPEIPDKQLYISSIESSDTLFFTSALFFFVGSDVSSESGTLKVCLRYDDGKEEQSENETDGVLWDGTWFAINGDRLILTLAGAFDMTLARYNLPEGVNIVSIGFNAQAYSYENEAGFVNADSEQNETLPSNSTDCIELLDAQS